MLYENETCGLAAAQQKRLLADLLVESQVPDIYTASLAQERLWLLSELGNTGSSYNVHVGLWLTGPLNRTALISSVREIVKRHDSFRTTFCFEDGKVLQVVARDMYVDIPTDDVTRSADPIQEAYRLATEAVHSAFDLATGPLFRVRLIRAFAEDHVFLCTMHHIVTDSWSMQLLVKELTALYTSFCAGQPSPLAPLPITYGDYSEWQRESFDHNLLERQVEYWKQKLHRVVNVLELPTDASRPAEQTFSGASQTSVLRENIVARVRELANTCQCTPFIVLLAAFKVLLYLYSRQSDVLVGVPVAGRNRVETEGLIGFFVNTLVLRDDLSGDPRFIDVLAQVRETALAAFAHPDVPFEKVVEVLRPNRNLSHNPIFQVMFTSIKSAVQTHSFGNLTAYPYVVSSSTSIFDLSATLIEATDGQWCMQFEYNTDLFSHERIQRMLADFTAALEVMTTNSVVRVSQIPVSGAEANRVHEPDLDCEYESCTNNIEIMATADQTEYEHNCKLLLETWRAVLGIQKIGLHDNFFEIGGHSLLAARLIRKIEKLSGRRLRVSSIFRAPTINRFARLLTEANAIGVDPVAMELCRVDGTSSLFAVAIPGVNTLGFGTLAHHMRGKHSVYKLQAATPVVLDRPFSAAELDGLAREYIAAMRSVQPAGPYCLAAMCDGAQLAQAIIVALEREGARVDLFAIFDTWVLENSMVRPLWALDYFLQRWRRFIAVSWPERWSIAQRFFARLLNRNQPRHRSGWKKAYWPGENFRPARFCAPILLFKRPHQPFYYVRDPQMGWGERTTRGVEICTIACSHLEFLREPHIRVVADKISCRLARVRGCRPLTVADAPAIRAVEVGTWIDD